MPCRADYSLYLVTDPAYGASLEEAVDQAVKGGCTMVQLREKDCSGLAFYRRAQAVRQITKRGNVPLIINDRVDIALGIDAEGVHVGQTDIPALSVRKMIGPDKILGVSAGSLEEARQAVADGADYLGVGAMFATQTKEDAGLVTMDELIRIRNAVTIPIVVIGGINLKTLSMFQGTGINGIAVVSAILSNPSPREAAAELKQCFLQMVRQ